MLLCSVAAKHKETKQFFTMYNTLEDTKVYLEKEVRMQFLNAFLELTVTNWHTSNEFLCICTL